MLQSFPPICNDLTTVMIIGSLPGVMSLAASEYYAHPTNHFWPIMAALTDEPLLSLQYEDRLSELLMHGIGLWDSVGNASRLGSSDAAINNCVPNELNRILSRLPRLKLVVFNGQTAARFGRLSLPENLAFDITVLPSTSAAYTIGLQRKISAWQVIKQYIESIETAPFDSSHAMAMRA